jgi:putative tricarboxylic transport membrane protein
MPIRLARRGCWPSTENTQPLDAQPQPIFMTTSPIISLPLSIALFALFAYAFFVSQEWPESAQQFPFTIAVPAVFFAFYTLMVDSRDLVRAVHDNGSIAQVWQKAAKTIHFDQMSTFFAYLFGVLLLTLLVGQKIAMPIYMYVYLVRWGKYSPKVALIYAFCGYLVLVGFYDRVMHLFWHESWIKGWAPEMLPDWLPGWLFF